MKNIIALMTAFAAFAFGASAQGTSDTPRHQTANLTLTNTLKTDSCAYHPGSTVQLSYSSALLSGVRVRYMHLNQVIEDNELTSRSWTWTPPQRDYQGYLAQVYQPATEEQPEVIRGTIAIDVSSDWRRFPRYGFVATFGSDKTLTKTKTEMEWLNRCHINGVQFQDWHNKHHWPWGGKDGKSYTSYKDIANRDVYTSSIKNYITQQHRLGMKSIFYNLCFGALDDAAEDGVGSDWYIYKDRYHREVDAHQLPSSWKSDIYLLDPGRQEWLDYLVQRNQEVYDHFDFDGYQIDQLGYRGDRYRYDGTKIDLPTAYGKFIRAMKKGHPDKRLIMNSVADYGGEQMAKTGLIDMHYNELWAGEAGFKDLYTYVQRNASWTDDTVKTTFAAYMNYECDRRDFNTPGILLTDAVMFALGAAHLELGGDHMLCREYFPYDGCTMSSDLKKRITTYYDFLVAYQNLLRDGGTLSTSSVFVPTDLSGTYRINGWEPQLGGITTIAREKGETTVLHLLNFITADQLSWRDLKGTMPQPKEVCDLPLQLTTAKKIRHVYVASPDYLGGAMQELDFTLASGKLSFTLPALSYWTMIVLEEEHQQRALDLAQSIFAYGNIKAEGRTHNNTSSYTSVRLYREADDLYHGVVTVVQNTSTPGYGKLSFFNDAYNSDKRTGRLGPPTDQTTLQPGRTDAALLDTPTEWLVPVGTWHVVVDPFAATIRIQPVGEEWLGRYVYVIGNAQGIGWDYAKDVTRLHRNNDGIYGGTVTVDGAGEITLYASTKSIPDWVNKRIGPMSSLEKPTLRAGALSTTDHGMDRAWKCTPGTWWMEYDPANCTFRYFDQHFFYVVGAVHGVGWEPDNTSVRLMPVEGFDGVYQGEVTLTGGDIAIFESTRQNVDAAQRFTAGRWGPTSNHTPAFQEWDTGLSSGRDRSWTDLPAGTYRLTLDMRPASNSQRAFYYEGTDTDGILTIQSTDPSPASPAYDLLGRPATTLTRGIIIRNGKVCRPSPQPLP